MHIDLAGLEWAAGAALIMEVGQSFYQKSIWPINIVIGIVFWWSLLSKLENLIQKNMCHKEAGKQDKVEMDLLRRRHRL